MVDGHIVDGPLPELLHGIVRRTYHKTLCQEFTYVFLLHTYPNGRCAPGKNLQEAILRFGLDVHQICRLRAHAVGAGIVPGFLKRNYLTRCKLQSIPTVVVSSL